MSVLDGWSYWLSKEQYIGKSRCNIEIYVYMNAVYMVSILVYINILYWKHMHIDWYMYLLNHWTEYPHILYNKNTYIILVITGGGGLTKKFYLGFLKQKTLCKTRPVSTKKKRDYGTKINKSAVLHNSRLSIELNF